MAVTLENMPKLVIRFIGIEGANRLDEATRRGVYGTYKKALGDGARRRRRRGEEGEHPRPRRRRLPDGREVELHPEGPPSPAYLVINADEGEPGTFKDRTLMERIRTR